MRFIILTAGTLAIAAFYAHDWITGLFAVALWGIDCALVAEALDERSKAP